MAVGGTVRARGQSQAEEAERISGRTRTRQSKAKLDREKMLHVMSLQQRAHSPQPIMATRATSPLAQTTNSMESLATLAKLAQQANSGSSYTGPVGKAGTMKHAVFSADNVKELFGNLEDVGWRIGETGIKGFDQVDPGAHAANGAHYLRPKKVGDLNWGAPGESDEEKRKIARLTLLLQKAGIPIAQLLTPQNDPNHDDHAHLEVERRRW